MNIGHFAGIGRYDQRDRRDGRGEIRSLIIRSADASRNIERADFGCALTKTATGAVTLTIRNENDFGTYPANATMAVDNASTSGALTVTAASGVDLKYGALTTTAGSQALAVGDSAVLRRIAKNVWKVST